MHGSLIPCNIAGGTLIHVWGHNLPEIQGNSQYTCKFGSEVVNATREAWNHVTCRAPQHVAGDVILEVSPDGVEYTNNDVRKFQTSRPVARLFYIYLKVMSEFAIMYMYHSKCM